MMNFVVEKRHLRPFETNLTEKLETFEISQKGS